MLPYLFVKPFLQNQCWMCASAIKLTREHKIKATDIRRQFGSEPLVIGTYGDVIQNARSLQSPNSKRLKFSATICEECNTSRTQPADRSYDLFMSYVETFAKRNIHPNSIFEQSDFRRDSHNYINLFRYFAKLIGCHIAELGGPIPIHLARFASQKSARNCIWIDIGRDPRFDEIQSLSPELADLRYAAHGGIIVITKQPSLHPVRFVSSRTIGPICIGFWYNLTIFEQIEIRARFPDFIEYCRREAISQNKLMDHSSR